MNCKKIIKDLRELNSQLKGQYRDEQNRNYCLQCKIDKLEKEKQELIEYLKKEIENLLKENQQLKDVINKVREDLKKHLNAKSYGNHKYELFDRKYLEDLLEMLKGSDE